MQDPIFPGVFRMPPDYNNLSLQVISPLLVSYHPTVCGPPHLATAPVSIPTPPTPSSPPPNTPKHTQRLMDGADKGGRSEIEPPLLRIDPKWYVLRATLFPSLTSERIQLPRCSQDVLPTHQGQRSPRRLLYVVQAGGDRVRYRLRPEV